MAFGSVQYLRVRRFSESERQLQKANDIYDNGGLDIYLAQDEDYGWVYAPYNYWGGRCPAFSTNLHGDVIHSPWVDSTHTEVLTAEDCPGRHRSEQGSGSDQGDVQVMPTRVGASR